MKFSMKNFLSKFDQIRTFLRIRSHLPKNSLMENFIFCAVVYEIAFTMFRMCTVIFKVIVRVVSL